jgi:hypothetical protein
MICVLVLVKPVVHNLNFYLQLGGKFVEIIQIFIITAAMMFQIQAVCWFGTELTKQVGTSEQSSWISILRKRVTDFHIQQLGRNVEIPLSYCKYYVMFSNMFTNSDPFKPCTFQSIILKSCNC